MIDGYVAFVRWPSEHQARARMADAGVPRLLLVEPGAVPPEDWAADEDWIRIPADPVDLHHRAETLRRAATDAPGISVDEHGLVRRGDRWVALGPVEQALVGALIERCGQVVRRAELEGAAWPAGGVESRALDRAIARARPKLAGLGLQVHCVTSTGYLLEAGDLEAVVA